MTATKKLKLAGTGHPRREPSEFAGVEYLSYIYDDPEIFTDEAREAFLKLPEEPHGTDPDNITITSEGKEGERSAFLSSLLDKFYSEHPAYSNFMRETIYKNPIELLEFFQHVKKSHLKKAGVDPTIYPKLQKAIETAEISAARLDEEKATLRDVWPIHSIRLLFKESELARLYYIQHPEEKIRGKNYIMPEGSWSGTLDEIITHLAASNDLTYELTETGRKKNNGHKQYSITRTDSGAIYSATKTDKQGAIVEQDIITVTDKELIKSVAVQKLFDFLLIKANEHNYPPEFYISYKELVEYGLYTTIDSARVGFASHIAGVQSLQINHYTKRGKKEVSDDGGGILFYDHDPAPGGETIKLNTSRIYYLAAQYAAYPKWIFTLSNNAYILTSKLSRQARIIRTQRSFNILLSTVREWLALPTREQYEHDKPAAKWKPSQYVKKPIEAALDEIEARQKESNNYTFSISRHFCITKDLKEWLRDSYITVTIEDAEILQQLKTLEKKRRALIEKAQDNTPEKSKAATI